MITIDGFYLVLVGWFSFVLAATFSYGWAYLIDQEEFSLLLMFRRHLLGYFVGVVFYWWLVGSFSPPFVEHAFFIYAIIAFWICSFFMAYMAWKGCWYLQSGTAGVPKSDPTFELEWTFFLVGQAMAMLVWSLNEWKLQQ